MKVLIVNTTTSGGAAKSCARLHESLIAANIDVKILLRQRNAELANSFVFVPSHKNPGIISRIKNKIKRIFNHSKPPKTNLIDTDFINQRPVGLEFFSYPQSPCDITESPYYQEADIIHLHWVADFLDWETFFSKNTKPVVWTLHDQNPFLGGEHYAERYLGIDNLGKPIPRQYTEAEINMEFQLINFKKELFRDVKNIYVVSPSLWLLYSSKESDLFAKFPHFHIPYGYPVQKFKPFNQNFSREFFGIPDNKIVLLFVANSIHDNRKGYQFLLKAIKLLPVAVQEKIILVSIGSKSEVNQQNNVMELGKITDERVMALAYSAADFFIIPSLEDNLPNTMIESILCGTPVIGFPTGGIVDVVINNETGFVCPEISVNALKQTIEKAISENKVFDRVQIAKIAYKKYESSIAVQAYVNLYKSIIK